LSAGENLTGRGSYDRGLVTARAAAVATVGGLGAGLIVGALARLDMRAIALVRGDPINFSIPGTVGILVTFVLMSLALALTYSWWPHGRGIVFWVLPGLALFLAVLFITPLRQELAAPSELLLFAPVALVLGPVAAAITTIASGALPVGGSRLAYRLLAVPAIFSLIVLPLLLLAGALQTAGVIAVPTD
jgi:hypothetical protein